KTATVRTASWPDSDWDQVSESFRIQGLPRELVLAWCIQQRGKNAVAENLASSEAQPGTRTMSLPIGPFSPEQYRVRSAACLNPASSRSRFAGLELPWDSLSSARTRGPVRG